MVRAMICHYCGVETGNCFGSTGKRHKVGCPAYVHRC